MGRRIHATITRAALILSQYYGAHKSDMMLLIAAEDSDRLRV